MQQYARYTRRAVIACLFGIACAGGFLSHVLEPAGATLSQQGGLPTTCTGNHKAQLWARTELYFGKGKPDGSTVTDDEFRAFLDDVITPRFPDGLTVLPGGGQFLGSSGMITREAAMFVILHYPAGKKDRNTRIEEIRDIYRKIFRQESVLRVDGESCVSF
jgi:hypothetical protein